MIRTFLKFREIKFVIFNFSHEILMKLTCRSLVLETDPYQSRPTIDILLPDYTHTELELFKQFIYTGELRWVDWAIDWLMDILIDEKEIYWSTPHPFPGEMIILKI